MDTRTAAARFRTAAPGARAPAPPQRLGRRQRPRHRGLRRTGHRHHQRRPGLGPRLRRRGRAARRSWSPPSPRSPGSSGCRSRVDMEAGYADDLAAIAENAFALASAGAVGINLEDGASPPEVLCERIAATKRGAARAGVDLFVNARRDVYLRGLVPHGARGGGVHLPRPQVPRGRRRRVLPPRRGRARGDPPGRRRRAAPAERAGPCGAPAGVGARRARVSAGSAPGRASPARCTA